MTLPTITVDDLKKCQLRMTLHMNMGAAGSAKLYECIEHPRLVVSDNWNKKARKTTRTYLVDNERCLNLEDVAFWLSHPPKYVLVEEASEVPKEAWEPLPPLLKQAGDDPEQGRLL